MQEAFAGVDIGGTRIKIGLSTRSGQLISSEVLETKDCRDANRLVEMVAGTIAKLRDAASVQLACAGVGCPGRINFASGTVVWLKSKLEFLEGVPLASRLEGHLTCPVICDNDVNTILAGEMRFGAARGFRDVIAITVGTGIGGAVAVEGNMVRGHSWAAGHFGYMSINPAGSRHVCGNRGVIEEHASQSGILRQVQRALAAGEKSPLTTLAAAGEEPGLREVLASAAASDPLACRLVERLTSDLGLLVANLIYAFDPELVLIGGGIVACRSDIVEAIGRQAAGRLDYLQEGATRISPMSLGDAGGVLGGAALAMDAISQTQHGRRAKEEHCDEKREHLYAPLGGIVDGETRG
jgi:glucokinase